MNFLQKALNLQAETTAIRRDIHQHPEIQHEEYRTAGIVQKTLCHLGMEVKTGVGSTGVLGLLEGNGSGPTLMIRADMDALSMSEANEVPYASQVPGKMHACGHDGHVAILLTTARLLAEARETFPGRILFLFQPAEEGGFGALKMLEAGALEWARPDYSLGLHLWNEMPVGTMVIHGGPLMAGAQIFEVEIQGKGGHGALPNLAVDPVLAAAQVTVALQNIVSRSISPLESAVVSVCMLHAGTASNVIPASATLKGTMRAFTPEIWAILNRRFVETVENTARACGCEAKIIFEDPILSTTNDERIARLTRDAALELLPDAIIDQKHQTMGSEDMSIWLNEAPGCFFFLGSANPDKGVNYPHHHPRFDFDEDALPIGAAVLANAAVTILKASA
ncbi:MAG: amidohydrolase [Anaerolineae bacterium]|nr:amidohydrolase [Anaerolineae bacterium]